MVYTIYQEATLIRLNKFHKNYIGVTENPRHQTRSIFLFQ
jgi:hypothetical protein